MSIPKISSLTFDKLFDFVEGNRFENETDRKIAEKILEAENDWGDLETSFENLNEFIIVLEKEVGEDVTKASLKKLLKKYNQNVALNSWKAESICSLLEIFELTKEIYLRKIFNELTKKVNSK
ncbi:hypothetical protein [Echinicola shivajiensis]|uniref:hypothetical protein n=1 Tax=Echinicola shivajiensis TaxID=1035916 RepID=UPI001BFC1B3A|nr:hypothetical protein [Echinicola shivajiensis]